MEDSSKSNYGFWLEGFLGFLIFRPKQPKSTIETNLNWNALIYSLMSSERVWIICSDNSIVIVGGVLSLNCLSLKNKCLNRIVTLQNYFRVWMIVQNHVQHSP